MQQVAVQRHLRISEQYLENACLYLASDEAEFITGIVLEVDGGRTI